MHIHSHSAKHRGGQGLKRYTGQEPIMMPEETMECILGFLGPHHLA